MDHDIGLGLWVLSFYFDKFGYCAIYVWMSVKLSNCILLSISLIVLSTSSFYWGFRSITFKRTHFLLWP